MPDPSPAPLTPQPSALEFVMDRIALTFTAIGTPRFDDRTIKAARAELLALREENERLRTFRTFKSRAAEALADEVSVLIQRRVIDSRSPAADALLDFHETMMHTPRSDRIAELEAENERLRRERADGGTKAMPPRPPPLPGPRPARAVAGTSLVCTECGCRWKKHPPDDVFSNGSLQLYDADQRPCAECCDNTFHPPLRHETPDDAKGDPA